MDLVYSKAFRAAPSIGRNKAPFLTVLLYLFGVYFHLRNLRTGKAGRLVMALRIFRQESTFEAILLCCMSQSLDDTEAFETPVTM